MELCFLCVWVSTFSPLQRYGIIKTCISTSVHTIINTSLCSTIICFTHLLVKNHDENVSPADHKCHQLKANILTNTLIYYMYIIQINIMYGSERYFNLNWHLLINLQEIVSRRLNCHCESNLPVVAHFLFSLSHFWGVTNTMHIEECLF